MKPATCENCGQLISRTGPSHPWYHDATGEERCDGKPYDRWGHSANEARPS